METGSPMAGYCVGEPVLSLNRIYKPDEIVIETMGEKSKNNNTLVVRTRKIIIAKKINNLYLMCVKMHQRSTPTANRQQPARRTAAPPVL